ncbi:PAS domain S-box protein [Myxosarcina sp. GI1]|uniref:PAS domain S-box protein n=1 Tax=Myxosarcina sp. GI1 TaxID=1541065 RepID=UPI00056AC0BD|nr:PAS domain S-box protein [Myxosarcina sp. GI1]
MTNNIGFSLEPQSTQISLRLRSISVMLSILVICLGGVVIFGWCFEIAALTSIFPGQVTMKISTALGFILAGMTLLLWHYRQTKATHQNLRRICLLVTYCLYLLPILVILFTCLTLIEYGFQLDLGTDLLSFRVDANAVDAVVRGRMSPNTALCFFWFNGAILFLTLQNYLTAQFLAVAIAAISLTAILGHIYDLTFFYGVNSGTGMAIHTALGFILSALALLGTRADKGWMSVISENSAGGMVARWLMPLVMIIPLLLAWFFGWALKGNVIALEQRIVLRIILEIAILSILVWKLAWKLNAIDKQRQLLSQELKENEERLRWAFEFAAIGKALVTTKGRFFKVNPALCKLIGYSEAELIQLKFQDITHPEDLDIDLEFVRQVLANEINSYQLEKRYIHKSGRAVWILLDVALAKDEVGNPKYFIAQMQDITSRKHAEKQLRQSEERYRLVVEDQTELIVRFERNGVITFVNQAYCHYFQRQKEEVVGKVAQSVALPEDESKVERVLQSLTPQNPVGKVEFRTATDEEIRWMQWVYRAIFNERNELAEIQSVGRDISDLVKTQEALRQSEELFRITLKNSPIAVYTQDTKLRYTWMYNAFAKYQSEQLIGKSETEAFSIENARTLATIKKKVLDAKVGTRKEIFLVIDDRTFHYDLAVEPLWNKEQNLVGLTCVALDISDRKQAEREVRQYDSIIRSFYNSNSSAMGVVELIGNNKDLIHISGNTAAAHFFGLERQKFIGSSLRKHIADAEIVDRWLDSCYRSQRENKPIYFEYIHSVEQESKYISVNISPINFNNEQFNNATASNFANFSYIVEDITERKIAARLKQKQLRIQEIHHRVKNNLQIISSLINLQTHVLKESSAVTHLNELKNKIQAIALIHEKLYQSENVTQINFSDYLKALISTIFPSYLLVKKDIFLNTEIRHDFLLDIDTAVPCGLIINELITNALKHAFAPNYRGEIKVIVAVNENDNLVLTIADNGKGLPTDFNLNNNQTLGLKLVKSLIAQLRGTVEVTTDGGTKYKITLSNT